MNGSGGGSTRRWVGSSSTARRRAAAATSLTRSLLRPRGEEIHQVANGFQLIGQLGFGGVVPYDVTEDAAPVLERDMTMIIHPNQYIPETGYMMLGDTVVIEDHGPRVLTQTPRRLFWKAA